MCPPEKSGRCSKCLMSREQTEDISELMWRQVSNGICADKIRNRNMAYQSELRVITAAKKLASYVFTITQKAPKQFRFSLVGRMQGYVLDVVESLYRANEVYVTGPADTANRALRARYQREAMTELKLLSYVAQLSMEQQCTQPKQFEQISSQVRDCQNLLGAWEKSDRKRFGDCM